MISILNLWNNVWPYLVAILLFLVLIIIHEFGHFIAAKLMGVRVNEFAVGFGPKLFSVKGKETNYAFNLIPFGGYCAMEGEDENSTDERAFCNKKAWRRFIIVVMGATFNLILGLIIVAVILAPIKVFTSTTVATFDENALSQSTGLMVDDKIIKVGNVSVHTAQELSYEIMIQGKDAELYDHNIGFETVQRQVVSLDLTVIRNGEKTVLNDVKFLSDVTSGTRIGVTDFRIYRENASFGNVMKQSFFRALSCVKMVWDSLVGLLSGRFAFSSVSGPVGTTQVIVEAAQTGWYTLLNLFIIISMNLGVFNLLPFLPLDGGHILFCLYEIVFRRPVPKKFEEYCQIIGVLLMFGLMIIVLVKDVINLF